MDNAVTRCDQAFTDELERVRTLLAMGKVVKGREVAQSLAAQYPTNPHAWHLLSGAHALLRESSAAIASAERASLLSPGNPIFLLQLGRCFVATGERRKALEIADRLTNLKLERPDLNDAVGSLLTYCDEPIRALPFFEQALKLAPDSAEYLYNLSTAQRMAGQFVWAEASLNRVISLRPDDTHAYHTLANLQTQTSDNNHLANMTRLLQGGLRSRGDEITLCFAIAKELEDLGRYEASFGYLKRGCDRQRQLINYSVADDIAVIDRVVQLYDRTVVDVAEGYLTDESIFVIGLPRSGTTLVERILGSHSDVFAAGELPAFPCEALKCVRAQTHGPVDQLDLVKRALDVEPERLGRAYIDATRPQTGKTPRFVDKLPGNYLYAGLIRRALPRARIVAVVRDPMDSCYAMYKTAFVGAYPFSYDLSELGQYYAAWHRLIQHWRAVIADNLLIIRYEDLVAHQEDVTRRILSHCGLQWQDSCLAFQHQKSAVTTASATQVRRAIYSSSVGKWRHVEQELRPLVNVLRSLERAQGWHLADIEP